jgi:MFS family permease
MLTEVLLAFEDYKKLFKNRNFFLLWLGFVISQIGDKFNQMALLAVVAAMSTAQIKDIGPKMGIALLVINLPSLVMAPIAGVFIDRWDKRKTMMVSNTLQGLLVLSIPLWLKLTNSLLPVYFAILIVYLLTCFFNPAQLAFIPDLVGRSQLVAANALTIVAITISMVIGSAIGDLFVSAVGPSPAFIFDSLTYFFSVACLAFIVHYYRPRPAPSEETEGAVIHVEKGLKHVWQELKYGFRNITHTPSVSYAIWAFTIMMSSLGPLLVIIATYAKIKFAASIPGAIGILYSLVGVGWVIGATLISRLEARMSKEKMISWNISTTGITMFILVIFMAYGELWGIKTLYVCFAIISTLAGIFVGPAIVLSNTILHECLPELLRGRVFGARSALSTGGFLVFMGLATWLSACMEITTILIGVGIVLIIGACINYYIYSVGEVARAALAQKHTSLENQ